MHMFLARCPNRNYIKWLSEYTKATIQQYATKLNIDKLRTSSVLWMCFFQTHQHLSSKNKTVSQYHHISNMQIIF